MYYAVINMDDGTVVSVEPSARSAQNTVAAIMHPAKPHLFPPVRNTWVKVVTEDIFIAYSDGKEIEFCIEGPVEPDGQLVPVVRVATPELTGCTS